MKVETDRSGYTINNGRPEELAVFLNDDLMPALQKVYPGIPISYFGGNRRRGVGEVRAADLSFGGYFGIHTGKVGVIMGCVHRLREKVRITLEGSVGDIERIQDNVVAA